MEYKNYLARIRLWIYGCLKNEAINEGRSVNSQLDAILKERYHAHAPPHASIQSSSSQFHNANREARKVKTKAAIN